MVGIRQSVRHLSLTRCAPGGEGAPCPGAGARRGGGDGGGRGRDRRVDSGRCHHVVPSIRADLSPDRRAGPGRNSALSSGIGHQDRQLPWRPALGRATKLTFVFEEPVEGAITRLAAVFQCQAPTLVGDVRSAREPASAFSPSSLTRSSPTRVGSIRCWPCWPRPH